MAGVLDDAVKPLEILFELRGDLLGADFPEQDLGDVAHLGCPRDRPPGGLEELIDMGHFFGVMH